MKLIYPIQLPHVRRAILGLVCFTLLIWIGVTQSATAATFNFATSQAKMAQTAPYGLCLNQEDKIDLNNANIIAFQDCPGFYPSLASTIVQHSPYQALDEVLEIEGLSEQQKQALQMNFESFKLSQPITDLSMRMPPRPSMRSNP